MGSECVLIILYIYIILKNKCSQALLLGLMLLLFSCTAENSHSLSTLQEQSLVTFSSQVGGENYTRASGNAWDAGDAIGVYMKKSGSILSTENLVDNAENRKYVTATTAGQFLPFAGHSIYFPVDGSSVDFVTYYPYQDNIDGAVYKVDLANQQSVESVDLMYADNLKGVMKGASASGLVFSHQLANLELNISKGKGISTLAGLTVTVKGMYTRADFNLADGTLKVDDKSKANIPMVLTSKSESMRAEAIVLPTESLDGISIEFSLQSKTYTLKLTSGVSLQKGKKVVYNITLKNSGVSEQTIQEPTWFETPVLALAENERYIRHYVPGNTSVRNYAMLYDTQYKLAYWVAYPMHKYYLGNTKRTNDWAYDPEIPASFQPYLNHGFGITNIDRGHQIPSADRTRDAATNRTTFYYSNMTAQVGQGLNQTIWANLENEVRSWTSQCDTLYVVTGAMITTATDKNIDYVTDNNGDRVAKPKYYYKVLAQKKGTDYYTIGFRFDNKQYSDNSYNSYRVTVSELEKETGFTFFPKLSSDIKGKIETSQWN